MKLIGYSGRGKREEAKGSHLGFFWVFWQWSESTYDGDDGYFLGSRATIWVFMVAVLVCFIN